MNCDVRCRPTTLMTCGPLNSFDEAYLCSGATDMTCNWPVQSRRGKVIGARGGSMGGRWVENESTRSRTPLLVIACRRYIIIDEARGMSAAVRKGPGHRACGLGCGQFEPSRATSRPSSHRASG